MTHYRLRTPAALLLAVPLLACASGSEEMSSFGPTGSPTTTPSQGTNSTDTTTDDSAGTTATSDAPTGSSDDLGNGNPDPVCGNAGVPGAADVKTIAASRMKQVTVTLDRARMAPLGLSADDVAIEVKRFFSICQALMLPLIVDATMWKYTLRPRGAVAGSSMVEK